MLTEILSNCKTPTRDFTYALSGQMVSDLRPDSAIEVTLNARGRMASVTRDGAVVASYGHDVHQLRVSKTLGDGAVIHYHYDEQGRMIAETDGLTGETLRDYVWFGLSPIAVVEPVEGPSETECDAEQLAALREEHTRLQAELLALHTQITDWSDNIAFREARIAALRAELDGLSGKKREVLEHRIAKWEELIASTAAKVVEGEPSRTHDRQLKTSA